ncbi:MAG: hypothetical protein M3P37_06720, partial [Actinomycetota bacterium]|nr:hypothetical protein [Actinomycetota bacterium]
PGEVLDERGGGCHRFGQVEDAGFEHRVRQCGVDRDGAQETAECRGKGGRVESPHLAGEVLRGRSRVLRPGRGEEPGAGGRLAEGWLARRKKERRVLETAAGVRRGESGLKQGSTGGDRADPARGLCGEQRERGEPRIRVGRCP